MPLYLSITLSHLGVHVGTQTAFLTFTLLLMVGCATISQTNDLRPGMQPEQVRAMLGEPKSTQFSGDKIVWKYTFHQMWKGYIPHYLVFDAQTQQLVGWFADQAEFDRDQARWAQFGQALRQLNPPPQTINLNVR